MKILAQRIAKADARSAQRGHVGVIVYDDPDDVEALLDEAEREGRIAPNRGVILLPADQTVEQWERAVLTRP